MTRTGRPVPQPPAVLRRGIGLKRPRDWTRSGLLRTVLRQTLDERRKAGPVTRRLGRASFPVTVSRPDSQSAEDPLGEEIEVVPPLGRVVRVAVHVPDVRNVVHFEIGMH